jgi:hypothetical protein
VLGTAFKNKGVQPLLDAVIDYMPAPIDVADINGVDPDDPEKVRAAERRLWGEGGCVWRPVPPRACGSADAVPAAAVARSLPALALAGALSSLPLSLARAPLLARSSTRVLPPCLPPARALALSLAVSLSSAL